MVTGEMLGILNFENSKGVTCDELSSYPGRVETVLERQPNTTIGSRKDLNTSLIAYLCGLTILASSMFQ